MSLSTALRLSILSTALLVTTVFARAQNQVTFKAPPPRVMNEFRYLGGALACISSGDLQIDKKDPLAPCMHIGAIILGATAQTVELKLGPISYSKLVEDNGATLMSYEPFKISFEEKDKKVISIKIWNGDGDSASAK